MTVHSGTTFTNGAVGNMIRSVTALAGDRKRLIRIGVIVLAAILVLILLTGGGKAGIVGTWECTDGTGDFAHYILSGDTYTFNEDHTYEMTQAWGYSSHGTYELQGKKLIMTGSNGSVKTWDNVERVGNTLRESYEELSGYRIWEKR